MSSGTCGDADRGSVSLHDRLIIYSSITITITITKHSRFDSNHHLTFRPGLAPLYHARQDAARSSLTGIASSTFPVLSALPFLSRFPRPPH